MLTRQEADELLKLLEIATEAAWWKIQKEADKAFDVKAALSAWKKVEAASGSSGVTPEASDFYA
jgi:hypothetical protein